MDTATGETLFQFPAPVRRGRPARSVVLETFADRQHQRQRVPMQQSSAREWVARLKLPSGWCLYRFVVDGRAQWDRAVGKMKTTDGLPCSLAFITPERKKRL